jgi:hypothetical protein
MVLREIPVSTLRLLRTKKSKFITLHKKFDILLKSSNKQTKLEMATQPLKARKYQRLVKSDGSFVLVQVRRPATVPSPHPMAHGNQHKAADHNPRGKLPTDKRCLIARVSRDDVVAVLSVDELKMFKGGAEKSVSPPKTFLNAMYCSENYVQRFGKKKRGSKAVNWRKTDCGEFLCPSLHDANNIYEALGKKQWNRNKNKQKYAPADAGVRCSHEIRPGVLCSKRKCQNSKYCTLHHRKITMPDRIA